MARSSSLGSIKEVELSQGTIRYRESGTGDPVVFLHGLLVNGDRWRKVVPGVSTGHRCIVPDLPLGAHEIPMRADADLTIDGLARLIDEFLAKLDLDGATLVANDTGGAITQVLMTEYPGRVGRVVLTSCDAYDNFLPWMFRPLQWLAWVPLLLTAVLQPLRLRAMRRLPFALGWLAKHPIDAHYEEGYVAQIFAQREIRRDVYKVLRDISTHYTLKAASKLGDFKNSVLIVWAAEDRFFPPSDGKRLAAALPNARFVEVEDTYTFISEDNPDELVRILVRFLSEESEIHEAAEGAA
jgi:pimeloyl-ACP methyl ester carboxylesterase